MSKEPTYEELMSPINYLNTRVAANIAGIPLTVPEAVVAGELAGLNVLLVSDTGWGKSQLVSAIYNGHFGGNENGIWMKARPDTETEDIFFRMNMEAVKRELNTASVQKLIYVVDEINRSPPPIQDKFLGMGDGTMETPDGRQIFLGRDGYSIMLATANMGNGEFAGTWELDRAVLNRLHITLDLDYFSIEDRDEQKVNTMGSADPKIREVKLNDISDKILAAWRHISKDVCNPGLEAEIALMVLGPGLRQCQLKGTKTRAWPGLCQDCKHAGNICELVKQSAPRTRRAVLRYAYGLKYMAMLKAKHLKKAFDESDLDPYDMIFTAFKLSSAYHGNLNPGILRADYYEENAGMMEAVYKKLTETFREMEDSFISPTLECWEEDGQIITDFVKTGKSVYPLSEKWFAKQAVKRGYAEGGKALMEKIVGKSEAVKPYEQSEGYLNIRWLPDMLRERKKDEE
jgi:hypothetical protein